MGVTLAYLDFKYAMVLSGGWDDGSICYGIITLDSETGRGGLLVCLTSPTARAS